MKTELVPEGRYIPVAVPELGITAHWVLDDDNTPYLAVRATCGELGVAANGQLEKLAADDGYNDPAILREFRIETGGGRQVVKCLRKAEAALWIATIKPGKVKPELAGRIAEIRAGILHAADRLVWGDRSGALTISSTPARGGDLHLGGCPRCHTPLAAHVDQHGITLSIVDTDS